MGNTLKNKHKSNTPNTWLQAEIRSVKKKGCNLIA